MKYLLRCITCDKEFPAVPRASTCPNCGPHKGTLDVVYPLEKLKSKYGPLAEIQKDKSVFEIFEDIFPFLNKSHLPSVPIGQTPQFRSERLAKIAGLANLWIKDDGRNPSASFKDRASAVAIAMASEAGASVIATASTGNAASSLATLAASTSLKAVVFVPRNAPQPKLIQILIHGAFVIRLDCEYDRAFDLCQEACSRFGWYNRNTAINPFTGEGKKSAALEIACDLGKVPDAVICSVGDGCIIGGIYKGFADLKGLGLIERIPRLYGVQASGAAPLVRAFDSKSEFAPMKSVHTLADSIAVGYPRDAYKALRAVSKSAGGMIAVSDEEILAAQRALAQVGGIFAEPAASASYAGLLRLADNKMIHENETVVVILTGHGLKDTATASKNVTGDIEITSPNIEAVAKKISGIAGL